jgi:hypothetical protein
LHPVKLIDVLAIALVLAASVAFVLGEVALASAEDLRAIYWLVVGSSSLRAATQVVRPGGQG